MAEGKDEVGRILQFLNSTFSTSDLAKDNLYKAYRAYVANEGRSDYKIKKFADKLKDITCLLIGCTRKQLEDREFKNKPLGEEWNFYRVITHENGNKIFTLAEEAHKFLSDNFLSGSQLTHHQMTPRLLMQLLGTECGRHIIHPNVWINALFADYKPTGEFNHIHDATIYPNWIITDVRFPNEVKAIKERDGIVIRINRLNYCHTDKDVKNMLIEIGYRYFDTEDFSEDAINEGFKYSKDAQKWYFDEDKEDNHSSETALDNYTDWDYIIDNNGTIEDLVNKVKELNII